MKEIKISGKDYILLLQQELNVILEDARSTVYVDAPPPESLCDSDLSATESRFIQSLRENVKKKEKIMVRQVGMNGVSISVFRFHPGDIG